MQPGLVYIHLLQKKKTVLIRVLSFSPKILIFLLPVLKVFISEKKQHQQKVFKNINNT